MFANTSLTAPPTVGLAVLGEASVAVLSGDRDELVSLRARSGRSGKDGIVDADDALAAKFPLVPTVGVPLVIQLSAGCTGVAGADFKFSCDVSADPTFAYDQAVFEAMSAAQGLSSFRLDDFFAFEVSPNVNLDGPGPGPGPSPIPYQGSLALVLSGCASLALLPAGARALCVSSGWSYSRSGRRGTARN